VVVDVSRVGIKEDETETVHIVEYWVSAKGSFCWGHSNKVCVKL